MKKIMTLEFDKCLPKDLKRDRRLNVITRKIHRAFKQLREFIIQQIFKGNKLPKRLEIYMEIWREKPLKKGARVIFRKHTLDDVRKCYNYREISTAFIIAFNAMRYICMANIRQVKRLPEKVVTEVEVK